MRRDKVRLADYLGGRSSALLADEPFCGWQVTRSTEEDLPKKEIWYEFAGHGVEVICDEAERVHTIFLHRGDGEKLSEFEFSLSRREVLERFGRPQKSGSAVRIAAIGDSGAWDRFTFPTVSIHVQYRLDCDEIEMITLMTPDAVPPNEPQRIN